MATRKELVALKRAARILWPNWGPWSYETWERLNGELFANALTPCGILFGLTPHGASLGYFRPEDKTITLHVSLLDPSQPSPWGMGHVLGERYAADVLLHEMVHQRLHQRGFDWRTESPRGTSPHNSAGWVDEVNRLSPMLGLDCKAEVIRQRRVKKGQNPSWTPRDPSALTREKLETWPHCARPSGYYP